MKRGKILGTTIAILLVSNISTLYFLANKNDSIYSEESQSVDLDINSEGSDTIERRLSFLEDNQLFLGKWIISDLVAPDYALPTRYSGFDENSNFRGPDFSELIKSEIVFTMDYVEYQGEQLEYAVSPVTYSLPIMEESFHAYYEFESLDIVGDYYSGVYYYLSANFYVKGHDEARENKVYIQDFTSLFIKDANTMYMSEGVMLFRLDRLE